MTKPPPQNIRAQWRDFNPGSLRVRFAYDDDDDLEIL